MLQNDKILTRTKLKAPPDNKFIVAQSMIFIFDTEDFFPAYFRLSPLQKHVRKVVSDFGKKSCKS